MKIKAKDMITGEALIIDFMEMTIDVGGATFDIVSSGTMEAEEGDDKKHRWFNLGYHRVICTHHSSLVMALIWQIIKTHNSVMMEVFYLTQSENNYQCVLGYDLLDMIIAGGKQTQVSVTINTCEYCKFFH